MRSETLEDDSRHRLRYRAEGQLIGMIMYTEELDSHYRFAMIDVSVDASHVGRDSALTLVRTLAGTSIDERGHHRITIDPAVANARAVAAYKKVGFKPVGVMRQYELGPDDTWRGRVADGSAADEPTDCAPTSATHAFAASRVRPGVRGGGSG